MPEPPSRSPWNYRREDAPPTLIAPHSSRLGPRPSLLTPRASLLSVFDFAERFLAHAFELVTGMYRIGLSRAVYGQ